MLKRSYLTSIIGFLVGILVYFLIEASTILVFLFGGIGYAIGMIIDSEEVKHQLDTTHFSNIPTAQEIFYSDDIPEALILYSPKENLTTVLIDFRVDAKPQDFRLSVLKNFQDFEFRIIEDTKKTMFSLSLDFPNCNYPSLLLKNEIQNIHFDIRERSCDFKEAMQKIIPGIVLKELYHPDIFGNEQLDLRDYNSFKSPFSSDFSFGSNSKDNSRSSYSNNNSMKANTDREHSPDAPRYDKSSIFKELIDYPPIPDTDETDQELLISSGNLGRSKNKPKDSFSSTNYSTNQNGEEAVEESEIIDDLLNSSNSETESPSVPKVFNLTAEEAEQLIANNDRNFDRFLNDTQNEKSNSNNHESGLLTADKIANMSINIPTYSDPNEKGENVAKEEEDLSIRSNMTKIDIENNFKEKEESSNKNANLDNEDGQEILTKENSIKFDFSTISESNDTSNFDKERNDFDNTIVGQLNTMIKKTSDTEVLRDEVKNIRKGLHPKSIQSQEL